MTGDNPADRPPIRRPVTTAEQVVEAVRAGATTVDEIVAHTRINPSVIGITLTNLTNHGVLARRRGSYRGGPGQRPFVYRIADSPLDLPVEDLGLSDRVRNRLPAPVEAPAEGDVPIREVGLSERPWNCLSAWGIRTVGDLTTHTAEELLALPNFGQKSLDEVVARLSERGLALRGSPSGRPLTVAKRATAARSGRATTRENDRGGKQKE